MLLLHFGGSLHTIPSGSIPCAKIMDDSRMRNRVTTIGREIIEEKGTTTLTDHTGWPLANSVGCPRERCFKCIMTSIFRPKDREGVNNDENNNVMIRVKQHLSIC